GTLSREAEWTSPADTTVRVTTKRLVSFTHRSVAAIEYEVEPIDRPARVVLQSELVANEEAAEHSRPRNGSKMAVDPREAMRLDRPLESIEHDVRNLRLTLVHRTRASGRSVAAAADHEVEASDGVKVLLDAESRPDWGRVTVTAQLQPGQKLRLVKYVSYG